MTQTRLDRLLTEGNFSNHDLVAVSATQLSHKNVQKARLGTRPVGMQVARTIVKAANALFHPETDLRVRDLFPEMERPGSLDVNAKSNSGD